MRDRLTLLLCLLCLVGFECVWSKSLPLPPYITPCSRKEVDLNECATRNGRKAIPLFIDGDRKYKIPPLDPLEISHIAVDEGILGLNFTADNLKIRGLRDTILDAVIWDTKKQLGEYRVTIPRIEIDAQYQINGKILILPITGNGRANLTFTDVKFNYTFDYELVNRDGSVFLLPAKSKLKFDTSRMYVFLDNLFNGNKLLADQTNAFMNDSWRDVVKELGPILSDTIGEIMRRILYNIFELVDYDTSFPENVV